MEDLDAMALTLDTVGSDMVSVSFLSRSLAAKVDGR